MRLLSSSVNHTPRQANAGKGGQASGYKKNQQKPPASKAIFERDGGSFCVGSIDLVEVAFYSVNTSNNHVGVVLVSCVCLWLMLVVI